MPAGFSLLVLGTPDEEDHSAIRPLIGNARLAPDLYGDRMQPLHIRQRMDRLEDCLRAGYLPCPIVGRTLAVLA